MKRTVLLFISILLIFSACFSACKNSGSNNSNPTDAQSSPNPDETSDPKSSEEPQKENSMDIIMLYDIDHGSSINGRPDDGWMPLNPEYPDDPEISGHYRTTTSLLGKYDSSDSDTIRQHFYWMAAMGVDGVQCDITNTRSPSEPGADAANNRFYNINTIRSFGEVLKVASQPGGGYTNPKAYPSIRLFGDDYEALEYLLDDMYTLYSDDACKNGWYKFNDGSQNADKPFIVIFTDWDLLKQWTDTGKYPFDDSRFNIRWSNGCLELNGITEDDNNGRGYIDASDPVWLFVENTIDPVKGDGYYKPYYKKNDSGNVEMMTLWASLHLGGTNWDGLLDKVDGKYCAERQADAIKELSPQALLVCRWNYALAWLEEPQEGVSRNKSTHIEPNVDWGFEVFYIMNNVLNDIQGISGSVPPAPSVTVTDQGNVLLGTDGMPLEVCISKNADFSGAEWVYVNIVSGMEVQAETGDKLYIKTRNQAGESSVCEFVYQFDDSTNTPEPETKEPATLNDGDAIMTAEQFLLLDGKTGSYTLGADIDLSEYSDTFTSLDGFYGTLDGQGHVIKNLKAKDIQGIFLNIGNQEKNATVKNIIFENISVETSREIAGILCSRLAYSTVTNVEFRNCSLYGIRYSGGLCAINDHSLIESVYMNDISIEIEGSDCVGGICAYSEFGVIRRCVVKGSIYGQYASENVGGICGNCLGNKGEEKGIFKCFVFGSVIGVDKSEAIGGIVGLTVNLNNEFHAPVWDCGCFLTELGGDYAFRICATENEKGQLKGNVALDSLSGYEEVADDGRDGTDVSADQIQTILDKADIIFDVTLD